MGQTIQVPGTFENIIDGKLANAEQIYDATEGKSQSAINAKVKEDVEAAEGDISNLQTAVADTYNKSAIDTALSAKQDSISDLATIRSGASAGATAVQPAAMETALADKQDTIADLATIRSGASAGATAVQPAALETALADKQDTIADLATIRSGASAGATAVQPADMTSALADKQDTIADLATIRSGASAGATAVQPAALEAEVSRAQAAELTKANAADVYTKTEVNGMVSTPHQNYVTVADYASLPAVADGQPDTIYRVANYDGAYNSGAGRVDATKYTEYAYSNNALILLSVKSAVGEVFDISEYNSNAIYNSLTEALGTNGANIPAGIRRGGMSVKFVKRINYALYNVTVVSNQDSSQVPGWGDFGNIDINEPLIEGNNITAEAIVANLDTTVVADHSEKGDALAAIQALALNGSAKFQYTDTYTPEDQQVGIPVYTLYTVTKTTNEATEYVQYRLMSTVWSIATSKWQGVDSEPTAGSDNLVKSGGVQKELAFGAVYDVSAKNPTAGANNDGKWASLSALLSDANLNTLIPTSRRKGGMSIKFVQSSDNKYIQARCMAKNFTTNVTQWQVVDDVPIVNSNNLIKSGGLYKWLTSKLVLWANVRNAVINISQKKLTANSAKILYNSTIIDLAAIEIDLSLSSEDMRTICMVVFDVSDNSFYVLNSYSPNQNQIIIGYVSYHNGNILNCDFNFPFIYSDEDSLLALTNKVKLIEDKGEPVSYTKYQNRSNVDRKLARDNSGSMDSGETSYSVINAANTGYSAYLPYTFENGKSYIINVDNGLPEGETTNTIVAIRKTNNDVIVRLANNAQVGKASYTYNCTTDEAVKIQFSLTGKTVDYNSKLTVIDTTSIGHNLIELLNGTPLVADYKYLTPAQQDSARNNISASKNYINNYTLPAVATGETQMLFLQYKFEYGKVYKIHVRLSSSTAIDSKLTVNNARSGASAATIQTLIGRSTFKESIVTYSCSSNNAEWLLLIVYASAAAITPTIVIEESKDIIDYEPYIEDVINNAKLPYNNSATKPLTLLHFSDIHGDLFRTKRIVDFAKRYNGLVDDVLCTGDIVNDHWSQGIAFWEDAGAQKVLSCIGNHDILNYNDTSDWATAKQTYDRYFAPYISNWGVTQTADASEEGKCYYYKDYAVSKVRLIVLDCMHYNGGAGWDTDGDGVQNQWLISTLADAKTQGLSVICAAHVGPNVTSMINCTYTDYLYKTGAESINMNMMNTAQAAIDSFVTAGGEFICWIHGHYHSDGLYLHGTDTIGISIDRASGVSPNPLSSCCRIAYNKLQDAFNVFAVDTVSKTIKLFKIGANTDNMLRKIGSLSINYVTKEIIYNE